MRFPLLVLPVLACSAAASAGVALTSTWVGPEMGVWSVARHWDPPVVPTNAMGTTYHVVIDAGGAFSVELDQVAVIDMLTLGSDDALTIPNSRTLTLAAGPVVNHGTIHLNSTGLATTIRVNSALVSLTGTGVLEMNNDSHNIIRRDLVSNARLHNDVEHTIRGAGQVGFGLLYLTNDGLIEASLPEELLINLLIFETNVNTGTLRASNGSTLTIEESGTLDNTGGVIEALNGSIVEVLGTTIVGGTLDTAGTGWIQGSVNTPTLQDLTNEGLIHIHTGQEIAFRGTIENNGVIRINSTTLPSEFLLDAAEVTLTGTGTLEMTPLAGNGIRQLSGSGAVLINGPGHTIRGGGNVGFNTIDIVNDGVIISDASPPQLVIDPVASFTNNGLIHLINTGRISIAPGAFTNTGTVTIDNAGKLLRNGDYVQTSGVTTVLGELESGNGTVHLEGGTLRGHGVVDAHVLNTGGTINPGLAPGPMTIEESFTQSSGGRFLCEIVSTGNPGNHYDHVTVQGVATLGGTLEMMSISEYQPTVGDVFTVLSAGSVTGTFDRIMPCGVYKATYTPTSVIVEVVSAAPTCTGDHVTSATFQPPPDGVIDGADLAYVLGEWGAGPSCADVVTSATFQPPPDGVVDGADLAVLLGAWGACE